MAINYTPQVLSFTSGGNPPNNIVGFNIERSVRPASGDITNVNDITGVLTVTFSGTPPADDALIGDQLMIEGDLLFTVLANTSSTITLSQDSDFSTISTESFIIINDLAEFGTFEIVGSITPTLPFKDTFIHQYTDSTGTMFDYYQIKSVDSAGTVSASALTSPFRPGQVVNLSIDTPRDTPQDSLLGTIGGSVTFEVTVILGGRRQDPKSNIVYAEVYMPSYLAPNGVMTQLVSIPMVRTGLAQYRVTWTIPTSVQVGATSVTIYPSDDYIISYKGNFCGIISTAPDSYQEFASEFFTITAFDGPVFGRFPAYATIDDLRKTFFEIDAYLPEVFGQTDTESRNTILQYHLETASDKLREELNMHQIRGMSSDRKEYVCARAVYTIFMAARGQNASAISNELLAMWRDRAEYILAQLKREGIAQGIPFGRG